jgi:cold shock CspA family protein
LPQGHANPGDQVSFIIVEEHNGPRAKDVQMQGMSRGPPPPPHGGGAYTQPSKGYDKGSGKGKGKGSLPPPPPMVAMVPQMGGGMPPMGPAVDMYAPSFVGIVKSFNPKSGWGMIECEMTYRLYGKDVFFGTSVAPYGAERGEQVRFSVKQEAKGPAAIEVTPLRLMQAYPPAAPQVPMYAPPQMVYGGNMKGAPPPVGKQPSKDHVYIGSVKSFNEEKGWGHIACEGTKKIYNKDVFLMKREVEAVGGSIPLGSLISFKVQSDGKGPKATDIRVIPEDAVGSDGYPGKQFSGIIKSFNDTKGWGFVAGDEILEVFGKDIFVNKREMDNQTPALGDQIFFHVEIDKDGQAQAKNIQAGAHPPAVKRQKLV